MFMTQQDQTSFHRHRVGSSNSFAIMLKGIRSLSAVGLFLLLFIQPFAHGQDNWPRFRGPNADGVAADNTGLPTTWTTTDNVKWVADVPGWGWSCPIVWGDRVFLTTVVSDEKNRTPSKGLYLGGGVRDPAKGIHQWVVFCFDLKTGKELWKQEAHVGRPKVPRHPKSTYAAETATTDGKRLYVLFGDLGLYCYDLNGKPLWSKKIEPKKTLSDYGAAASPVVHDGQVIVVYDNRERSWIAAFDAESGDERWRTPREETHSWATPFVWTNEVRTEIVVSGRKRNRSYSLDGKLLWEFDGKMSGLVIPSPFAAHGLCYIASGYVGDNHRPTFAVRPGASGDLAPDGDFEKSEYIAWYQGQSSSYNTSQIVYGDYLYTLYDRGFLTCHDAKTGKEVYGKRRFSPRGSFTSSPWAYNGHLFFLSEDGLTYAVKAGPEFEIIGRSDLDELCLASPAIVGNKLLIRTASALYCMTEGAKLSAVARRTRRPGNSAQDIWSAAAAGKREEVLRSLKAGTSVDAKNPNGGTTPLMMAALFGQTEVARLLIEKGADVSLGNKEGNTALHMASFLAHQQIVNLLLRKGASANTKNTKGETALDVVSADWSPELESTYKFIGGLLRIELDLKRIRLARPKVAKLLRDHVAKNTDKDSPVSFKTSWQKLPNMPVPRWEAGTVVLDDKLYVFGGYTKGTRSSKRADVFDPQNNSWRQLADLPSAITHMNAVLDGRSVWLAGGFKDGYKGHAITEVWKYDIDKNTYTAAPSLPQRRAGGGLALVGRRLHYIGGLLPDRVTDSPDHWVLDLDAVAKGSAEWKNAAPLPAPRNQFGTVTLGGKIYAIGGQFGHDRGQDDQARVDIYDPQADSWSRGPDLPKPHSHAEGSTFISGGRVFMLGGMTREGRRRRINAEIITRLSSGKWKVLGKLPRPLSSPAAAIIDGRLFVAGGSLNGADPQPGMWVRDAQEKQSIENKTKVHRLSSSKRAAYDAFVYVNRIPEAAEEGESAKDVAGRIFGRLANQEGRILLKLPPGMNRDSYLGFKTFFRYEGKARVGNCAACHTPAEFTDLKAHVVTKGGSPKLTPSLRNLKKRKVDIRKAIMGKISASSQKRSRAADKIDDAYAEMNISKQDVPGLVAFLNLLNDVSDLEFRKLILNAKLLDTSQDIEGGSAAGR
jgi:outer membrane protein assembly factor BamB/N-acetylneuraminic acid mutarotase